MKCGKNKVWLDPRPSFYCLIHFYKREVVDCRDGFPEAAEAPCRWRHEMWQEQGVAGSQRDQRDCQCQLPPEHPQAHQGWSCHQEACCCPLQVSRAQERRGAQERQAHWFW